jgi:SH3-like domain-containing protein
MRANVELERHTTGTRSWTVVGFENRPETKSETDEQVASLLPANDSKAELIPNQESPKEREQPKSGPVVSEKSPGESKPMENVAKSEETAQTNSEDSKAGDDETTKASTEPAENPSGISTVAAIRGSTKSVILRRGPGTTYGIVKEIGSDTPIKVLGQENSWYKVRVDDKEGFVYAGLLDYKQPDAYTVATIKQSKGVTDESNRKLASLQVGDRLVVLGGIKNNKYKVQLANGKVGYVDKDAVEVAVDAPPLVP